MIDERNGGDRADGARAAGVSFGPGAETRASQPREWGFAESGDGLRLYWECYGSGSTTVVLLPPNPISHSRIWKAQVHYLARHHRVVVFDGRGNGRSDSPEPNGPWRREWYMSDCLAVMDATGTAAAVLAGICGDGVWPSVQIAAAYPERVLGIVALAPGIPLLTPPHPWRAAAEANFEHDPPDPEGWQKHNRHHIRRNYRDFLEFFFGEMLPEPHSEKQIEDAVAYGLDGPVEALLMDLEGYPETTEQAEEVCRLVRCPVLVIQGDRDNCQPLERGFRLAELTRGEHVLLRGAGHIPNARHPVLVNTLIHDFADRFDPPRSRRRTWVSAAARPRRALLLSSPIGLGHAWRDVAISRELRRIVPDLEVHWLAQPPLTTLLEACGETIHPASSDLAPEAPHVDAEGMGHQLHAFGMLRRLDEIFCANYMVFDDVVRDDPYDVWIADEAWEVDYFLHENPERKRAPYVWLTDFVGVLPIDESNEREVFLATDYNAQMLEHIARHPRVRDRSIFVGDPDDIVPRSFGPGLPDIPDWTSGHFDFAGYVTGFEPEEITDRDALRSEFGYRPDEKVCLVAAGGSAVGAALLQKAIDAFPHAKRLMPELRMIVVAGPRLDPRRLAHTDTVETTGYIHRLYRHLAACDIAVSHGGLSTTMELTASARPFLYFPLRDHFEQNFHVHHRLQRHRAGSRMSFDDTPPDALADRLVQEIGRETRPRPVPPDGAARAATLIAEVL